MTKKELAQAVQKSLQDDLLHNGLYLEQIEAVINHTLDNVKAAVYNGQEVTLRGFGTFKPVTRKARPGRNISAGTTVDVPAKRVVKFKPAKSFDVNQEAEL
jgi:DNA-binding protein HU-beta